MQVGFVGLGQMGAGMAANLLKAGHELTVYNRTRAKAAHLAAAGAKEAASPGEAAKGEAVVTMLADDAAVESAVFSDDGILKHLPEGALHVSSSTISVALSHRLAEAHARAGQLFVSAPVFGRPEVAAAGSLVVVAAGTDAALGRAKPLLEAIGQKLFVVSDKPEMANLIKLSGNFLIACAIESLGEAIALVAKAGVDKKQYVEILTSTLFNAPVYRIYGDVIAGEKFEPAGFAAILGQKDIRLALAAAEQLHVPLPVASLLRDRFLALIAQGGGKLDWSAISTLAAKDAGMHS